VSPVGPGSWLRRAAALAPPARARAGRCEQPGGGREGESSCHRSAMERDGIPSAPLLRRRGGGRAGAGEGTGGRAGYPGPGGQPAPSPGSPRRSQQLGARGPPLLLASTWCTRRLQREKCVWKRAGGVEGVKWGCREGVGEEVVIQLKRKHSLESIFARERKGEGEAAAGRAGRGGAVRDRGAGRPGAVSPCPGPAPAARGQPAVRRAVTAREGDLLSLDSFLTRGVPSLLWDSAELRNCWSRRWAMRKPRFLFFFPPVNRRVLTKNLEAFFSLWIVFSVLWNQEHICHRCLLMRTVSNSGTYTAINPRWSWLPEFTRSTSQPASHHPSQPGSECLKILLGEQGTGFSHSALQ